MGNGDRMTGGVSLVSKFKVTNLVLVKDEELPVAYIDFSTDLTRTMQAPQALLVLAPQLLFGNVSVFLGQGIVVLGSSNCV
jgi:hypothetical protein